MVFTTGSTDATDADPVRVLVERALRRNRLTSFFRLPLVIPHLVVLLFLAIAAFVVTVIAWFSALVLGRVPTALRQYLAVYLGWSTRVLGYYALQTDRYPPFDFAAPDYPIQLVVPPAGRLNRIAVFFRIVLVIPAYVMTTLLSGVLLFVAFAWFAAVLAGRTPRAVFDAIATLLRYQVRFNAYALLLTPTYPWGPLGDRVDRSGPSGYLPPQGYPPQGYPPGYGEQGFGQPPPTADAHPEPRVPPRPSPYPQPPVPAPSPQDPYPQPAYPQDPYPAASYPPGYAAATVGWRRGEPAWYDGVVTGGGRAILIVSLVLGGLYTAGNISTVIAGGGGGFGSISRVFDLSRDQNRFDEAVSNASCPDDVSSSSCGQQVAASLLAASAHLRTDAGSGGQAAQRGQLLTAVDAFDDAVRHAVTAGTLVDASGAVVDVAVLSAQTQVDDAVSALQRARG